MTLMQVICKYFSNYSAYSSFALESPLFRTQSVTYVYMLPHSVRNNGDSRTKSKHPEQLLYILKMR